MRRAILWGHRWVGLALALVISFLGISGASLVFRPEIDAKLNPNLLVVAAQNGRIARLEPTFRAVEKRFPDRKISYLFAAKTSAQSHEWWLDGGEMRVYSDPFSGEILGSREETAGVMPWLFRAHTELFAGETGEQIAAWSGLALFSLAVSGLILWLPRRKSGWKRAFWPQLKTNWQGRVYELHRVGGLYLSGFLMVTTLAGMALVWHDLADVLASPLGISNVKKQKSSGAMALALDDYVARANAAFPDGKLSRIGFPTKTDAPLIVRKKLVGELHPNGMNNIALDARSGAILQISDSRQAPMGQRLLNLRYPIHIGVWGGPFSRILAVLVGWSPLLLSLSGFLMWRRRVSAQKRGKSAEDGKKREMARG